MAFADEQCPARGPGVSHAGIPNCFGCGVHTQSRSDSPTVSEIPIEPAARSTSRDCHCYGCCNPTEANADVRALHRVRHQEFDQWLADRALENWQPPSLDRVEEMARQEQNARPFVRGHW